ncbi:uncharacterized protein LOC106069488 isoform X3 [Biomphalaria glabrata]|uniref:Uncharacterized protein LOC106069488 isoform X3 n=1 Tax=Biomphalaria glabrata TaxID=6526 RepID=A0A9W3AAN2_BIOGL|nr:uncharacterized protein LOC106069488 isoform X3 [Biomphalaria glabrata]
MLMKVFILCIFYDVLLACPLSYFGPSCRYQCHCQKGCDKFGACLNGSTCATGWFGFLCQLKDLTRSAPRPSLVTIPKTNRPFLHDDDIDTCVENMKSFIYTFVVPTHITFFRVIGFKKYRGELEGNLTVWNDNRTVVCVNGSYDIVVDNYTLDVYCRTAEPATVFLVDTKDYFRVCHIYASNACRKGHFGLNCLFKCSSSCYNGSCDPKIGLCLNGCFGFSNPPQCNIPCKKSHGHNCICSKTCKVCRTGSRICETCLPDYRLNMSDRTTCFHKTEIKRGFSYFSFIQTGSPVALCIILLQTFLVVTVVVLMLRYHRQSLNESQAETD